MDELVVEDLPLGVLNFLDYLLGHSGVFHRVCSNNIVFNLQKIALDNFEREFTLCKGQVRAPDYLPVEVEEWVKGNSDGSV